MAKTSPTQRTLKVLRENYQLVQVVEHWNAFARRRQDLFGFIDIVAVGNQTVGIQCTSASNMSARIKKIREEHGDRLQVLKQAGWRIEVWGWKKGSDGKWGVRVEVM